mmetsp:Transcript_26204/g.22961  ORF Transcript_26204/g.22961 Transcript_26204/m.22961 type:complete len:88 (-) Transcript_26204:1820-2083(-)
MNERMANNLENKMLNISIQTKLHHGCVGSTGDLITIYCKSKSKTQTYVDDTVLVCYFPHFTCAIFLTKNVPIAKLAEENKNIASQPR